MELEESTCLTSGYATKPQSSRQSSRQTMVLAQRQKYRLMEQNRKINPEINPHTYGQRKQEYTIGKRQSLTSAAGKTGQPLVKE